jgi:hypothetical protein
VRQNYGTVTPGDAPAEVVLGKVTPPPGGVVSLRFILSAYLFRRPTILDGANG